MSKQDTLEDSPFNLVDQYSDSCELADGRSCFGPGLAIQRFIDDCKSKKVAIANGETFRVEPDHIPIVLSLKDSVYDLIVHVASSKEMSVQEFIETYITLLMEDEEITSELSSDLEKIAENDNTFGVTEDLTLWSDSDTPPPTDTDEKTPFGVVTEDQGISTKQKKRIVRFSNSNIDRLADILDDIYDKKNGDIGIWFGFNNPDEVALDIEYNEDGIKLSTVEKGELSEAFKEQLDRLEKWQDLTFGPKLEEGTEIEASIGAKVLGFDKKIGKYKVEIAEGVVVDIDVDQIGAVLGAKEKEKLDKEEEKVNE